MAQPEIYPMPMFATFQVRDVQKSVDWYRRALSFTIIYEMPGPDGRLYLAHMRRQKYQDLLLVATQSSPLGEEVAGKGISISFDIDDIEALARIALDAGAKVIEGPVNRPWNTRELVIRDPDGYRLVFTQPLPTAANTDFSATMGRVMKQIETDQGNKLAGDEVGRR